MMSEDVFEPADLEEILVKDDDLMQGIFVWHQSNPSTIPLLHSLLRQQKENVVIRKRNRELARKKQSKKNGSGKKNSPISSYVESLLSTVSVVVFLRILSHGNNFSTNNAVRKRIKTASLSDHL